MKKICNNVHLLLLLVTAFFSIITIQAQDNNNVRAKIKLSKTDYGITIMATVINNTNKEIDGLCYEIQSRNKTLYGNISRNKQVGVFSILDGEQKTLSKHYLYIQGRNTIKISLIISKNNKIIDKHLLIIDEDAETISNKTLINNVTTERGNDFCDYLCEINKKRGVCCPFEIKISEKTFYNIGTTEIQIFVEDKLIYKFKTLENKDYLIAAAQETNKRLQKYLFNTNTSLVYR